MAILASERTAQRERLKIKMRWLIRQFHDTALVAHSLERDGLAGGSIDPIALDVDLRYPGEQLVGPCRCAPSFSLLAL